MQKGDLELWTRPRYVVVIEGVLCKATPIERRRRLRTVTTGFNISWYEIPLKRLQVMKDRWPGIAQDYVTFISQDFADEAAEFLNDMQAQYDTLRYQAFDRFVQSLSFQTDVASVYDSDQDRLDQYGQRGHSVVASEDF